MRSEGGDREDGVTIRISTNVNGQQWGRELFLPVICRQLEYDDVILDARQTIDALLKMHEIVPIPNGDIHAR